MKRRFFAVLLVLLLVGQLAVPVSAADTPMSSAAAYYLDDTLYAFARFPNYEDAADLQVGLMVHGVQVGAEQAPEKRTGQEKPAKYMLLIDCSTSMPAYQDRIMALADALMASEQPVEVTVASFGVEFRVAAEGLTDAQSVRDALAGLSFGEQGTDICGGAIYAIDYMKSNRWEPGELVNLILITDGVPFYSYDTATEAQSENATAAALKEVLTESPQVLFHSLCFDAWEPVTYDAVSAGIGYHLTVDDAGSAAEAGKAITELYGSLYGLGFPLQEYAEDLALRISNREFISVYPMQNLTKPEDHSVLEGLPIVIDSETDPESTPTAPEESTEPSEPASEEPPEGSTPPAASAEEVEPEVVEPEAVEAISAAEPTPIPKGASEGFPLALAAAIGAAVLVGIVLTAALLHRKKKRPGNVAPAGIQLRLEVLYGSLSSKKRQFVLSDSLFIGSDRRCGVILPDAAPLHARVFLQDGAIFIEDLNSPNGTALAGMRIYAPNPLRSGEQIMIGQNCFAFYF